MSQPPLPVLYDALCFGAICADLRLLLPHIPAPGQGVRVAEARWEPGGNSLIEARALVGWGVRVALLGDRLGTDEPGALLAGELGRLGLDTFVRPEPTARTVVCHVMVTPDGQRTILALRPDGPPPALPPPELLRACRVVSVTRYGARAGEAAALARAAGATVVAGDATRPDDELTRHADVIVTSAELLADQHPGVPLSQVAAALHEASGAAVIITDGPRPARALWRKAGTLYTIEATPPAVLVRDSTGAGDIFRGAVVRGLVRGWGWPKILTQAVADASAAIAAARE